MLTDTELDSSSTQLAAFRLVSTQQHESLTDVLEKYATLVEDYKSLKSDYEEARDSRERYKQMARGQERNPFVLVLVDGDGYVFEDDLVSNKEDGGQRAAQLLDEAVKRSLRDRGLEQCRIMVRIYANLSGLSKVLSRVKLAGPEKRSLAPFAANFTRTNDLFDFVDAGELKENADSKIRALFRQFVDNPQCKHIYFAGCHDVGYINELTPHASNRDRITLVRHPAFHHEFAKLGMRIEEFPNIFRSTPLDGQYVNHTNTKQAPPASPYKAVRALSQADSSFPNAPQETTPGVANRPICWFYQTGSCKYGKNCKNLHVKDTSNGNSRYGNLKDVKKWRETGQASNSLPFQMVNLAKNDNAFMTGHQPGANTDSTSNDSLQNHIDLITQPPGTAIPEGHIAVNARHHRIDNFLPASPEDFEAYTARAVKQKLCNNLHLNGYCTKPAAECPYDHSPAPPGVINALRQIAGTNPCPKKGACRRLNCVNGHVCQKADCKYRGGKAYCKFPAIVHAQNLDVAGYAPGEGAKMQGHGDGNGVAREEESVAGSGSVDGSAGGSTPKVESDVEQEQEQDGSEGALLDVDGDDATFG